MTQKIRNGALLLALLLLGFACKTKNDIDAFKEAEYSLESIDEVRVNGINMLDKKGAQDFSMADATALFMAFSDNSLQAKSTLGLNVNLGEGNEDRTMTVTQLKWQLLVDEQEAVSGIVQEPVELKNGLNTITVNTPLKFAEVNGGADLNNLLRLTTLLNSEKEKRPDVILQIKPTIQTSVGPVELPSFINIKK
ncbi:hypothetical protein I2I11_12755 [Pontibacter sp. 172403-2]|uniref:hypothetical protein n=1 Tax=Pontibacter rufus TaxID=2791028 RepID=UPI0018AF9ABE|nr:hypothetical protein [Pontibacter sp. 172403-2]MBF9254167.1 hypothetical protein [Pontibacter sp. 172403-2]